MDVVEVMVVRIFKQEVGIGWLPKMAHSGGGEGRWTNEGSGTDHVTSGPIRALKKLHSMAQTSWQTDTRTHWLGPVGQIGWIFGLFCIKNQALMNKIKSMHWSWCCVNTFLVTSIAENCDNCIKIVKIYNSNKEEIKLDGVRPVDNRPSTD